MPVAPTDEMRADVRATMPELPAARRTRLIAEWGIKEDDARVLVNVPGLVDYTATAIAALKSGTPKDVVNWVRQDVLAYLNDTSGLSPALLTPEMLAELVDLVTDGTISRPQAKDVLDESLREDKWPRDIVEARGIAQVSDEGAIAAVVDEVIAANADVVADYRAGDEKTKKQKQGFLFGQIKRALGGDANPQMITKLLLDRLDFRTSFLRTSSGLPRSLIPDVRIPGVDLQWTRLRRVAEQQFGLITRAQALSVGLSDSALDRRIASGRLIVVHPGVYRVPGAPGHRSPASACGDALDARCHLARLGRTAVAARRRHVRRAARDGRLREDPPQRGNHDPPDDSRCPTSTSVSSMEFRAPRRRAP